jgi:hypothetical protein
MAVATYYVVLRDNGEAENQIKARINEILRPMGNGWHSQLDSAQAEY